VMHNEKRSFTYPGNFVFPVVIIMKVKALVILFCLIIRLMLYCCVINAVDKLALCLLIKSRVCHPSVPTFSPI
jgi:hypothetical protein